MQKIKIKFDFSHGPIWADKYDAPTGKWSTGISLLDNDAALIALNEAAEREYSSLYSFDKQGSIKFDTAMFEKKKDSLLSFVQTIILRMNSLNDGSFEVIDEASATLKPNRVNIVKSLFGALPSNATLSEAKEQKFTKEQ